MYIHVCVCVREREGRGGKRERDRERERERGRERRTTKEHRMADRKKQQVFVEKEQSLTKKGHKTHFLIIVITLS